jgi:hypothetical protein
MAEYGNVPETDVSALQEATRAALKVAAAVPEVAPAEWKPAAYEIVLNGILSDWIENGTNDLTDGDVDDLTDLLRLSADTALMHEGALRDVTFRVVLTSAMLDWVKNWNDGDDLDEDDL